MTEAEIGGIVIFVVILVGGLRRHDLSEALGGGPGGKVLSALDVRDAGGGGSSSVAAAEHGGRVQEGGGGSARVGRTRRIVGIGRL